MILSSVSFSLRGFAVAFVLTQLQNQPPQAKARSTEAPVDVLQRLFYKSASLSTDANRRQHDGWRLNLVDRRWRHCRLAGRKSDEGRRLRRVDGHRHRHRRRDDRRLGVRLAWNFFRRRTDRLDPDSLRGGMHSALARAAD